MTPARRAGYGRPAGPPPGWRYVATVTEGADVLIGGLSPWGSDWTDEGRRFEVPHPSYPSQRHALFVYSLPNGQLFATGELSNGVWCFYAPGTDTRSAQ